MGFKNGICRIRLTDWFVAYQGSGNLGDSKAAHSCGSQKFWSVQSLSLSPDSGLGDTDRSYFDFHSIFSDFAALWYSGLDEHFKTNKYWIKKILKYAICPKNNKPTCVLWACQKFWNPATLLTFELFLQWDQIKINKSPLLWRFYSIFLTDFGDKH